MCQPRGSHPPRSMEQGHLFTGYRGTSLSGAQTCWGLKRETGVDPPPFLVNLAHFPHPMITHTRFPVKALKAVTDILSLPNERGLRWRCSQTLSHPSPKLLQTQSPPLEVRTALWLPHRPITNQEFLEEEEKGFLLNSFLVLLFGWNTNSSTVE